MTINAVLLDLDNTLLNSDMDTFLPPYFKALGRRFQTYIAPDVLTQHLMRSTRAVYENRDAGATNEEVFHQNFRAGVGELCDTLTPEFATFYEEEFPALHIHTSPRPAARPFVQYLIDRGYRVVIATNPMFPQRAVEHRLQWAGVGDLPFTFLTTLENSHFCKPNPDYYREVLSRLECTPSQAIMIGDSLENDILPAADVGLNTYWIRASGVPEAGAETLQGTLAECAAWVKAGGLWDL